MADLAERVGLRKASLFHHFASKEQLRRAVLERLVQRVSTAVTNEMGASASRSFSERLDALTDAVVGMLGEQPYAARLLIREVMEWGPSGGGALRDALVEALSVGEKFVAAGQQSGALLPGDPKQVMASVMGVHLLPFAMGGLMEQFMGHAPWTAEFVAERRTAVRLQLRAMLLKP
jgi:AcrR family transcriptional regulator